MQRADINAEFVGDVLEFHDAVEDEASGFDLLFVQVHFFLLWFNKLEMSGLVR